MRRLLLGICLYALCAQTVFAITLHEAKERGLVGERNDGYVGYVVTPPNAEVDAMVKDVNNKRREKFTETARDNNIQTEQVALRFYQRAVQATATGHYFQDAEGNWIRK